MSTINVHGIGVMPGQTATITSRAVNYDNSSDIKNRHNEAGIVINTIPDSFSWWPFSLANDKTTLTVSCNNSSCDVKVAMNSEAHVRLFGDGHFHMSFDRTRQRWSLQAYQQGFSSEAQWGFCSPDVVMGQLDSILTFLAADAEMEVSGIDKLAAAPMIKSIAQSFKSQHQTVLGAVTLFPRPDDCSKTAPGYDNEIDYPVPD